MYFIDIPLEAISKVKCLKSEELPTCWVAGIDALQVPCTVFFHENLSSDKAYLY